MLVHSFDRFYVVTKFMLPMIGDLKFSKLNFDYYLCIHEKRICPKHRSKEIHVRTNSLLQ